MKLLSYLKERLSPPYSLRTAMMAGATLTIVLLGTLFAAMAYKRLSEVTLSSAQEWSDSVAHLAARSNTSNVILGDIAAIESNLFQLALLPGIDRIALYRESGRELVSASKHNNQVKSEVGGSGQMPVTLRGASVIAGSFKDSYFESWAPISTGKSAPSAWVQVHYGLGPRNAELSMLWQASAFGILALAVLVLVGLHFIIGRAVKPIRELSLFAQRMPGHIGSQARVAERYTEVASLGLALNGASREIEQHVARTNAIVNTATEAIFGLDELGRVTTLNPAAMSFFGQSENTLVDSPIERSVPGLNIHALNEMFDDAGSYYPGMSRIVRKDFNGTREDGTLFPVEISLGKVNGIAGLRYVCIIRDVTDERAALAFTELYERALDCSHNSVFITNAKLSNQPIVYVNEAFQAMMELPLHEILGRDMEKLLGLAPQDPLAQDLRQAIENEQHCNLTLHKRLQNGRDAIWELSLSPVRSDKGLITHFIGIVLDVTARASAEAAIAKRRAQLDTIFSLSPDGFVLFDANDKMVFANPAFMRMTGLEWTENKTSISLRMFEPFLRGLCDTAYPFRAFDELSDDSPNWQASLHLTRPQTRVVQGQCRRNIAGQSETIFYFRDVTHEDTVDRMKSEFLAAAAHELRTPMVSIFGFTELLIKRKFTPERQTDMLETIHRQSGLLVKMINELLDLARIESRRGLDLKIDAHPLRELVVNSVKGLMRKDTERQVEIGALPEASVLIDPEKMQLAMNNLLSNAFKYSPKGGQVRVSAKLESHDAVHYAVIEVQDQGIGMSKEHLSRAFERFFRADASGNIPGTGLGLSMVKEVATLHKGKVELDSVYGEGTTARLWIPLTKQEELAESV